MNIANVAQREVLLFDLDGTLVDSATDLHRAMNMSLNALQLPTVTEAQVRVWVGKGTALFCQSTLQHLTGKVDPAQQQQLLETFLKIYNADPCVETQPFDGILEFLEWGLAQKKTMICVTNKPELPARAIVDHLGMAHYFADVIGGDRFEERKPHPRQLLHCVEQYAQSKDQVLMIGDSSNDVEAARRAGIDCVVVSYGYNHGENILDCQPQQVVDNLCELIG
ncbi:MAG TPA: HAD-IA family hydrolase [Acinetobacter johnsonii]|jgi:phosphoglycolate phosphatase|uniref:phosphoglycolate phosphatase n=1 Tax=Acinetobacter johnsonii TaxID=40214 RepID=A0A2W5R5I0_ACIJO|nr:MULTISPECIES: HAD-IA family hydrolase [Acinetobacter]NWK62290.1 HAD-IA family hydrolase [Acinetobacter sp. SwsAc3]MDH1726717.1 HAD-IA family hydrolase [Acinetobacter johnsonii]MWC17325.1 HAD-IA family hydrolase [Acinetobacter johnsonii]NWK59191.1 HAD-IA family hydrolase [Acinetobacter sp. SwsAc2]PZQ84252.1 MAG: phosphoglycolate phosphatase [Acinetobacter johnsonii]